VKTITPLPPSLPPSLLQALAYFHPSALLRRLAASPALEVELLERREKKEGEGRRAGRRKGVCLRYDPRERVYHVLCEEGGREGEVRGEEDGLEGKRNGGVGGGGGGGREGKRVGRKVIRLLRAEELVSPKARTQPVLEHLLTPVFAVWRKGGGREGGRGRRGGVWAMGEAVGAVDLDKGEGEGGREGGVATGAEAAASSALWELPALLGMAGDGGRWGGREIGGREGGGVGGREEERERCLAHDSCRVHLAFTTPPLPPSLPPSLPLSLPLGWPRVHELMSASSTTTIPYSFLLSSPSPSPSPPPSVWTALLCRAEKDAVLGDILAEVKREGGEEGRREGKKEDGRSKMEGGP